MIGEGIEILQNALARDQLGEYQAQAAIAALHADAQTAAETDWPQIVEWYDDADLQRQRHRPVEPRSSDRRGEGRTGGTDRTVPVDPNTPRYEAVSAYLHERTGSLALAAVEYANAARRATSEAERDHLNGQAARLRSVVK